MHLQIYIVDVESCSDSIEPAAQLRIEELGHIILHTS